jgi:hypothetical protein
VRDEGEPYLVPEQTRPSHCIHDAGKSASSVYSHQNRRECDRVSFLLSVQQGLHACMSCRKELDEVQGARCEVQNIFSPMKALSRVRNQVASSRCNIVYGLSRLEIAQACTRNSTTQFFLGADIQAYHNA